MRHNKSRNALSSWQMLWILGLIVVVATVGMFISQQLLLDNARTMGKNLVTSYSTDEDRTLREYESMISLGLAYLDDMTTTDCDTEAVRAWAMDFFDKYSRQLAVNPNYTYTVVDGLPATVDGLLEQPWYQRALEARGQVIFTNAYFSGLCGQLVVTVAAELPVSYFQTYHVRQDLPARGGYYVCDINGNLLYHNVPFTASDEDLRAYVEDLFDRINQGEPVGKNNSIIGMQGLQRGLYYQHMENGWLCILTVPYDTLLQGVQDILKWYALGLTLFMVLAIGMWLRDRRLTRTARRTAETVQVLGNIFYAIYHVNAKTGTYEITKGSDFVMQNLEGDSGDYTNLLRVITSGLDEWTGEEFSNSFSLENIKRLVDQQVQDFGGEFLRQTGEAEPRWISIRLLTDPERIPNEAVLCFRDVEEEKEQQQVRLLKALWPPRNRAKSLHGSQTLRSGTNPGN